MVHVNLFVSKCWSKSRLLRNAISANRAISVIVSVVHRRLCLSRSFSRFGAVSSVSILLSTLLFFLSLGFNFKNSGTIINSRDGLRIQIKLALFVDRRKF